VWPAARTPAGRRRPSICQAVLDLLKITEDRRVLAASGGKVCRHPAGQNPKRRVVAVNAGAVDAIADDARHEVELDPLDERRCRPLPPGVFQRPRARRKGVEHESEHGAEQDDDEPDRDQDLQ
jgi:hypothetical protein